MWWIFIFITFIIIILWWIFLFTPFHSDRAYQKGCGEGWVPQFFRFIFIIVNFSYMYSQIMIKFEYLTTLITGKVVISRKFFSNFFSRLGFFSLEMSVLFLHFISSLKERASSLSELDGHSSWSPRRMRKHCQLLTKRRMSGPGWPAPGRGSGTELPGKTQLHSLRLKSFSAILKIRFSCEGQAKLLWRTCCSSRRMDWTHGRAHWAFE